MGSECECNQKTDPTYELTELCLGQGSHDLEQMNQSTRALMAKLRVPVFEWAAKLAGSGQYEDLFHWDVAGSANW